MKPQTDFTKLSDEALNVLCAEACGAKWYLFDSGYTWLSFKDLAAPPSNNAARWRPCEAPVDKARIVIGTSVPNYTASRDACAAGFEKGMTEEELKRYGKIIVLAAMRLGKTEAEQIRLTICTPSRQRVIAWLTMREEGK